MSGGTGKPKYCPSGQSQFRNTEKFRRLPSTLTPLFWEPLFLWSGTARFGSGSIIFT